MKRMHFLIALTSVLMAVSVGVRADEPPAPEYVNVDGERDNWLYCPANDERWCRDEGKYCSKFQDVLYLGPSVVQASKSEGDFCATNDWNELSAGLAAAWRTTAVSFAPMANVYAPCYRQLTGQAEAQLTNGCSRLVAASNLVAKLADSIAYSDVTKAMDAYFTNFNPHVGRPFFLVGEGQGAALLQLLMDRYFTNVTRRAYLNNLVACYANGHVVDADWPTALTQRTGLNFRSFSNLTDRAYKTYVGWVSETGPVSWAALPEDASRRRVALREERTLAVDPSQPDAPALKRFRTITNAVEYARANAMNGCTIDVAPGVYRERVTLPTNIGYAVMSTQPLGAVIDGEGWHRCVEMPGNAAARASFHGFEFRNGYVGKEGDGGGVYNCDLYRSVVSNCFAGAHGGGVAFGSLDQCLVVRNRCGGAGGGACYTSFNASTIANNFAAGTNRVGGVFNEDYDAYKGLNSIVALNNPSNAVGMLDLTLDRAVRIFADGEPRFVDPEHDDYRLRADSPCVDAGFGDFARYDVDLDGNPRVLGAEVDFGCYEHLHYAALPPGSLNVSSNAHAVGTIVYAQRPWNLTVESEGDWLSADVVSGEADALLHVAVAENKTGATRIGRIFLRDAVGNVQTVRVDQVATSLLTPVEKRKGVFVGVSVFEKVAKKPGQKPSSWAGDIPGCVEDSVFYRELWCGADPGERGLLFTNAEASVATVSNAVESMIAGLQPDEEFVLSFSTHGGPGKGIWESLFVMHPNKQYYTFGLMTNQLKRAAAKCRKVIVMVDACHSAGAYKLAEQMMADAEITETRGLPILTRPKLGATPQTAPYAGVTNIAFIMAADYDETSLGEPGIGHGVFTYGVMRGFQDGSLADADGDGYLDLHELYRCGRAHSSDMAALVPVDRWQARCYNKNLLLETRVRKLDVVQQPKPYVATSPYYYDFANWLSAKGVKGVEDVVATTKPDSIAAVATNVLINVGGRQRPSWEAFVALGDAYRPERTTNDPFMVTIALDAAGKPFVGCEPDLSSAVPRRSYVFYGKSDLTNAVWQVVTTNDLKGCKFFKADVSLP